MFGACEKSEEFEHTCNYAGLFSVPSQSVAACAVVAYGLYQTDCHEARCKLHYNLQRVHYTMNHLNNDEAIEGEKGGLKPTTHCTYQSKESIQCQINGV